MNMRQNVVRNNGFEVLVKGILLFYIFTFNHDGSAKTAPCAASRSGTAAAEEKTNLFRNVVTGTDILPHGS